MIREPMLIGRKQTWPDQEMHVEVRPYRGQTYVAIRRFYLTGDGEWAPGRGGLNFRAQYLDWIISQLTLARDELIREGMLTPEDAT